MNSGAGPATTASTAAPGATFRLTHDQRVVAVDQLRNNFGIAEQGNGTGILGWSLTNPSPALAERILSTIGDIYVTQNIQRQSEEARKSLEFLSKQVPEVRGELANAEQQLNAYRSENDSVDISMETQSVLDRVVNLESQLNELEFSEAEISRRFTPSHPTYAALLEKKAQLQKELNRAIAQLPEELRSAFLLREYDGLSYEDIAGILECPIGTVRSRIFRARDAVDRHLGPLLNHSVT